MQDSAALSRPTTASDLESRAADIAASAEQPLRALSPDRTRDYFLKTEDNAEIDREDEALIQWAREYNRFISTEEVARFVGNSDLENVGNKEHDVWKVETSSGDIIPIDVFFEGITD